MGEDFRWLPPAEQIVLEGIVLGYVDFAGLDAYSHVRILPAFRFRHYDEGWDKKGRSLLYVQSLMQNTCS